MRIAAGLALSFAFIGACAGRTLEDTHPDASADGSVGTGSGGGAGSAMTGSGGGAGSSGGSTGGSPGSGGRSGGGGTTGAGGSGGSAGSGGTAGSGGSAGSAGAGGLGGAGGSGGVRDSGGIGGASDARGGGAGSAGGIADGGAVCTLTCIEGLTCCNNACVNIHNDILNCGGCGIRCTGDHPFCNGQCGSPPCSRQTCDAGATCCGVTCCSTGQLCCQVQMGGPAAPFPTCVAPTEQGTCPVGCPACVCAAPDTPIATPSGHRPIATLRPGDLVYSIDHGSPVIAPIRAVNRVPAPHHSVVHVRLAGGATLDISPAHPTADGRTFAELRPGDFLDGVAIDSVSLVPYEHSFTYDILPDSDTGAYFAAGVLIGSTLATRAAPVIAATTPLSR